jgi:hypothetical protein
MTVRTDSRRPGLAVVSSPRADAGCRRPGPAAARADAAWPAVAPGRCRPSSPRAGSGAITVPLDNAAGPALTNERCAVPRHAVSKGGGVRGRRSRGRAVKENTVYIRFAHECAVSRKCWHKVYTRDAKASEKVCSQCDQKQKKFTQQV